MLQLQYFSVILIFLSFLACRKPGGSTTITGVVMEYGTNKPISNMQVELFEGHISGPVGYGVLLPSKLSDYKNSQTDGAGKFSFSVKRDWEESIQLNRNGLIKGYFLSGEDGEGFTTNVKASNAFFLAPIAFLKAHLINSNPLNSESLFLVSTSKDGNGDPVYYRSYKTKTDTVIYLSIRGNSYPSIIQWQTSDKKTAFIHDTIVYCPGRDTLSVTFKN